MPGTELSFFIGKGGVGKTTVSAAFAVRRARLNPDKRVLLLSTDPAHSLADVLDLPLSDSPKTVPNAAKLNAWQINSEKLFSEFLRKHKENILRIIDAGSIFARQDIEPLLNHAVPGMAEISALLAIHDAMAGGKYSHIVVDTAPFGHTLRLFEMPANFLRFLDFLDLASSRDRLLAQHFGGHVENRPGSSFINAWREVTDGVNEALNKNAKLYLVTTPETFALNESVRCSDTLKNYSPPMLISAVVLNRCVLVAGSCRQCRKRAHAAGKAKKFLNKHFHHPTLYTGEDPGRAIVGVKKLANFAEHVFDGAVLSIQIPTRSAKAFRMKPAKWPVLDSQLAFVLGKGGVGKTTISAAMGFATRRQTRRAVQICSVDPAPSLHDIFQKTIAAEPVAVLADADFRASEIDSVAIFDEWVGKVRADIQDATQADVSGFHLDLSFERQLLSALLEIVPPGVDEVMAVFRILDLLSPDLLSSPSQRTVIDMAPTGHGLELLRTPARILAWTRPLLKTLAAHRTLSGARDAAAKIAELGQSVRELTGLLKSRTQTRIHIVMLPELLPDRETERLSADLRRLDLVPKSIFVNRIIFPADAGECPRCRLSMQAQQLILADIKKQYRKTDIFLVRNFPREISGKSALTQFTGEMWQLA